MGESAVEVPISKIALFFLTAERAQKGEVGRIALCEFRQGDCVRAIIWERSVVYKFVLHLRKANKEFIVDVVE